MAGYGMSCCRCFFVLIVYTREISVFKHESNWPRSYRMPKHAYDAIVRRLGRWFMPLHGSCNPRCTVSG